jgi:hypothetical protein
MKMDNINVALVQYLLHATTREEAEGDGSL